MEKTITEILSISAMGIGVVFAVLVLLMGLLYLFPLAAKIIQRKEKDR